MLAVKVIQCLLYCRKWYPSPRPAMSYTRAQQFSDMAAVLVFFFQARHVQEMPDYPARNAVSCHFLSVAAQRPDMSSKGRNKAYYSY